MNLKLSDRDLDYIASLLLKQPLGESLQLYMKLQQQIAAQQQHEAAEEKAKKDAG